MLVINPRTPAATLTYKVGAADVALDGPHVLIGAGAVSLLDANIGTLTFSNTGAADAELDILVGRDAT